MKHYNTIYFNKSRNQNYLKQNPRLSGFSSSSLLKGVSDSTLNEKYKQFPLRQINMHLDTKMLELIAKMNDEKTFEMMKSQFDEDKKILLSKALKNYNHSNSDYIINNHLNLNNFQSQLNKNYTYDAADNLLILSFFDKIKTRRRKVYKLKENHYIDILYQGTSSPKKNKNLPKNEKPKFDMRLLLKSNSDLDAYFKKKEHLNFQKVSFKERLEEEGKESLNKSFKEEYKSLQANDKINKILHYKRKINKRRKSVEKIEPVALGNSVLSIISEEKKNSKSTANLPNIKNKNLKENNINTNSKKDNKILALTRNKESIKMELLKNNIIKITNMNKERPKTKSKEQKSKYISDITKKEMSKTLNERIWKDNISPLRIKLSENERIQYMNRLQKQKFNNVISVFNEKEKRIEKKFNKINKLIIDLKNKEKSQSATREKSTKMDKKLIEQAKDNSAKKTLRLYKEWNEVTSLFHFPLINKVIYKNKKNFDNIDKIKTNLKKEYSNKVQRNRREYTRKIDGKRIIKKLNDRYQIERLKEFSEELREKQRKEEQFENIEI